MSRFSKTLGAITLIAMMVTGCAAPSRFEFGGYDGALYAYSKHPDKLPVFEQTLQDAIASGKASGRLAPGLEAELGYLYLGEGKRDAAITEFKAEMSDFPEARVFMLKIISQTAG